MIYLYNYAVYNDCEEPFCIGSFYSDSENETSESVLKHYLDKQPQMKGFDLTLEIDAPIKMFVGDVVNKLNDDSRIFYI